MPLNADHEFVKPEVIDRDELIDHLVEVHGLNRMMFTQEVTNRTIGERHQIAHTMGGQMVRPPNDDHSRAFITRRPTEDLPAMGRWSSDAPGRARPVAPDTPNEIPDPDGGIVGARITTEVEDMAWRAGWLAGYEEAEARAAE
jgi:hypothetical protein